MPNESRLSLAPPPNASSAVDDVSVENVSVEERLTALETRCQKLEAEQSRFMNALVFAGKFIFDNPASKMLMMSMPKEMKTKLQDFFAGVKS